MNETEFLDLLRYYFRNGKPEEVKEILSDYESHLKKERNGALQRSRLPKSWGAPEIFMTPTSRKAWWMKGQKPAS